MQFDEVLRTWKAFLDRERIPFALIGGLAMHAWGYSRTTHDADLAVPGEEQPRVIAFAESLGYKTRFVSHGYSNHDHHSPELGRIDLMYVYGDTAAKLFATAETKKVVGDVSVPVARPEMIAAMKATAMKNQPMRVLIDGKDVQFLLTLPETDRSEVRDYFARQGMLDLFDALQRHSRGG